MTPEFGANSPEMRRSSVDLPDPERPSSPTISPSATPSSMPSSTSNSDPSALGKAFRTAWVSSKATAFISSTSAKTIPAFGVTVERPPERTIKRDHEQAHHRDAEHDAAEIARLGRASDIGAQPLCLKALVAPGRNLCNDAGVPRASRCCDRTCDIVGEHPGQRDFAPPQPAPNAQIRTGKT